MSIVILLLIVAAFIMLLFSGSEKLTQEPSEFPSRCQLVSVFDIEPPHSGTSEEALKMKYLEAETTLVEAHDAQLADSIRRSMAGCLIQGWPVDVAIAQSCYSFSTGVCKCPTCKSLVEARQ